MEHDQEPSGEQAARVAYKDLCVDVTDLEAGVAFLGPLLGLTVEERRDTVVRLGDGVPQHALWLNLVDEPRTVKNRVHLDVDVASVDEVLAAGATVVDDRFAWTVMTQEQAGEFCAFVREPARLQPYRLYELVVDSNDMEPIAAWWAARFGVEVRSDGENVWLEGGDGPPWAIAFEPVPERKSVKNRVHWDVYGSTAALLDAGATLVRAGDEKTGLRDSRAPASGSPRGRGGRPPQDWDVLADPQGNEFCVFAG